eukprot:8321893-Lingulodinium_polyedra.AAC.1
MGGGSLPASSAAKSLADNCASLLGGNPTGNTRSPCLSNRASRGAASLVAAATFTWPTFRLSPLPVERQTTTHW